MIDRVGSVLGALIAVLLVATPALAAQPEPWQLNLQAAASPVMERLHGFNTLLNVVIVVICLVVLGLLALVVRRFNERANPTPSRRTHNTVLEVVWTALPVLILVMIAIPSFKILYFMDRVAEPEMTLKAIGRQWYWSYEYPDFENFTFDAYMVPEEELEPGQPRLLQTDTAVVVPTETNIRVLVTASDVLHSWAMPSLGVKTDAVPGRLNETWIRVEAPGVYYGQCSELCGVNHGFMPIMIRAVPKGEFDAWVQEAQAEYARADTFDVAASAR